MLLRTKTPLTTRLKRSNPGTSSARNEVQPAIPSQSWQPEEQPTRAQTSSISSNLTWTLQGASPEKPDCPSTLARCLTEGATLTIWWFLLGRGTIVAWARKLMWKRRIKLLLRWKIIMRGRWRHSHLRLRQVCQAFSEILLAVSPHVLSLAAWSLTDAWPLSTSEARPLSSNRATSACHASTKTHPTVKAKSSRSASPPKPPQLL